MSVSTLERRMAFLDGALFEFPNERAVGRRDRSKRVVSRE